MKKNITKTQKCLDKEDYEILSEITPFVIMPKSFEKWEVGNIKKYMKVYAKIDSLETSMNFQIGHELFKQLISNQDRLVDLANKRDANGILALFEEIKSELNEKNYPSDQKKELEGYIYWFIIVMIHIENKRNNAYGLNNI